LLPYVLVDSEGEEDYCLHYPGKPPHLIGMAHTSVDVASTFSWEVNAKEPIFTARAHAWFSDIDNIFYEQDVKVAMWAEATVTHPTHDQKWTNSSLALQGRLGIFIKVYAMVDAPGIRTLRSRPDIRISWALQRLT